MAALVFCSVSAKANSYSYHPITKEELPSAANHIAVWTKPQPEEPSIATDQIPLFLEVGIHSTESPGRVKQSEFRNRTEQSAIAAIKKDPGLAFESEPIPNWRTKQLDAFEAEHLALQKKYLLRTTIKGAFLGPDKRIFLWWLISPGVLRVESGGGLCYLELPDDAAVKISTNSKTESALPLPVLPDHSGKFSRDFYPGAGNHEILKSNAIEEFLATGKPVDAEETKTRCIRENLAITWKWFPDVVATRKSHGFKTPPGEIIGGYVNHGSFASVFTDKNNQLWRAKLLSDFHLELTDHFGNATVLEISTGD